MRISPRVPIRLLAVIAVLVVGFASLAAAKKSVGSTIAIPPGAKVSVQGQTVTMRPARGGVGVGGTWECACSKSGTCTVITDREME